MLKPFIVFTAISFGIADSAYADEAAVRPPPDSLFNPVSDNLLTDLASDRPTKLFSPVTVDAAHFQIEIDFANYAYGTYKGVATENYLARQAGGASDSSEIEPPSKTI